MRHLPNSCSCSDISVFPKNWDKPGASVKDDWRLQYYFYDPGSAKKKLLCIVKRMNKFRTLEQRREITKLLIKSVYEMLEMEGYNPIRKTFTAPVIMAPGEIEKTTPLNIALDLVKDKLKVSDTTKIDIKSALKFFSLSATDLKYDKIPIHQVGRKHISLILDNCPNVKDYWSPHLYNHYRTYLMMCFKKLVQLEAIDSNPVNNDIPKETTESDMRETLTMDERNKIDEHFMNVDPDYRRFLHIFFHSGARPVELLRLTTDKVDLNEMYFKIKVRKRKKIEEEKRPIKLIAMQYWRELLAVAKPGQYIFGPGLRPGSRPATRDYVTKKYHREIKDPKTGLGINKDLYSLKHSNLDETAEALSLLEASKMAGHTSPVITLKHYTGGEKQRQDDRLRGVKNKFAG